MTKRISIKYRLDRIKNPDVSRKVIAEWAQDWQREQDMLVKRIGRATADDDFDAASIAIGELKAMTGKRFQGLRSVIDHLLQYAELKALGVKMGTPWFVFPADAGMNRGIYQLHSDNTIEAK